MRSFDLSQNLGIEGLYFNGADIHIDFKNKLQVLKFLSDCSIPWQELNNGCLTVKMNDVRNKQWDMPSVVWFT